MMPFNITDNIYAAYWLDMLAQHGAYYIVGGYTRNQYILQHPQHNIKQHITTSKPRDIDIAFCFHTMPNDPRKTLYDLAKTYSDTHHVSLITKGYSYGVIGLASKYISLETALMRRDINPNKRHSKVEFINDLYHDAARRDFTINALYHDKNGTLIDPYNALDEPITPTWRFIGNPATRIKQDYSRIMRLWRFYSQYGGVIEPKTLNASVQHHTLIQHIAPKKYQDEYTLMTQGNYWAQCHDLLHKHNIVL